MADNIFSATILKGKGLTSLKRRVKILTTERANGEGLRMSQGTCLDPKNGASGTVIMRKEGKEKWQWWAIFGSR